MKRAAFLTAAMVTGFVMMSGGGKVYAAGAGQAPKSPVQVISVNQGKILENGFSAADSALANKNKLINYLTGLNGKNGIFIRLNCLPGEWNGGILPEIPGVNVPGNHKPGGSGPECPDGGGSGGSGSETPDGDGSGSNKPDAPETPDNKPDAPDYKPETPDNQPEVPDHKPDKPDVPDNKPDSDDSDQQMHSFALRVVELVNEERAKAGLNPLSVSENVTAAAQVRAVEIETLFSHTRPDGTNFLTALKEAGVSYRGYGENIAWGQKTPEQVMQGWMKSAGHRANILNAKFTTIGVGYHKNGAGVNYWTQLFTY